MNNDFPPIPMKAYERSENDVAETVFRTVGHHILSFLSIRDTFLSCLTINQQMHTNIEEHYLYRYSKPSSAKVEENKLLPRDAFVLTAIVDILLCIVDESDINRMSQGPTQGPPSRDETLYPNPPDYTSDSKHKPIPLNRAFLNRNSHARLMSMVLQQFHTSPETYLYGCYDELYDTLFNDCDDDYDPLLLRYMQEVLEDEVQYWVTSRVFDTFIVLFEREDGTILVSLDDSKVYLATNILGSFSQLVLPKHNKNNKKSPISKTKQGKRNSKTRVKVKKHVSSPIQHHEYIEGNLAVLGKYNPLKGKKITCMLYPFQDMIVTDGSIWKISKGTPDDVNTALQLYLDAEDKRTIIASLPKVEYVETRTLDSHELQQVRQSHYDTLELLKKLPQNSDDGIWILNEDVRQGYIAIENLDTGEMFYTNIEAPERRKRLTLSKFDDQVIMNDDIYIDRETVTIDTLFDLIVRLSQRCHYLPAMIMLKPCHACHILSELLIQDCNMTVLWDHDPLPEWNMLRESALL